VEAVERTASSGNCTEQLCECVNVGVGKHEACKCRDPDVHCWYTDHACFCSLDNHVMCAGLQSRGPAFCPTSSKYARGGRALPRLGLPSSQT